MNMRKVLPQLLGVIAAGLVVTAPLTTPVAIAAPSDAEQLQAIYTRQQLIDKFYTAFEAGDAETMVSCYHPNVQFEDPAFGKLTGKDAKDMWRMLIAQGGDGLKVKHKYVRITPVANVSVHPYVGYAHWDAWYTFSLTGNPVYNAIDAAFTFKDGLIYTHKDSFDFQRWSSQALGLPGIFLGGHPFFQKSFQGIARERLKDFQSQAAAAR
jgi:hypothetical protein